MVWDAVELNKITEKYPIEGKVNSNVKNIDKYCGKVKKFINRMWYFYKINKF